MVIIITCGSERVDFIGGTDAFPDSANLYDSLGEAYLIQGNKDMAIKNYKKSLELNPDNQNAAKMLKNS
ncbi:MAG: tetratricopeptide repeat protein [Candidatus Aminicenantes bacterium]|nr:tetratricopeptide repeat protein [Candidatus Aminicenantes bacterium]